LKKIEIHIGRTNTQTHRAVLHADDIKMLIAREVCAAAGVSFDADSTSVNVQLSSRMGSYSQEFEAMVTVTVDYEKMPTTVEASQ
jgi:hypothetical protein